MCPTQSCYFLRQMLRPYWISSLGSSPALCKTHSGEHGKRTVEMFFSCFSISKVTVSRRSALPLAVVRHGVSCMTPCGLRCEGGRGGGGGLVVALHMGHETVVTVLGGIQKQLMRIACTPWHISWSTKGAAEKAPGPSNTTCSKLRGTGIRVSPNGRCRGCGSRMSSR